MKQIKMILGIALIAMIGIFTACEEDETATLTITPDTVPDSIQVGTEVTLKFSVIVDEKIESIELRKGTTTLDTKTDGFTDNSSDNYSYTGVLADTADAGKNLSFALIVTDNKGNDNSRDFEIYVKELETTGDPINTYSDVTIGSISYNTTDPTYYDASTNTLYMHDDADAYKSDLGYIYGSTNGATVCSPDWSSIEGLSQGTGSWNSQRSTRFLTTNLTTSDFDNIGTDVDSDLVIDNTVSAPSNEYVNHLEVGGANENVEVIGFKTEDGNKGLIKIVSIDQGSDSQNPDGSGTITVDVKIQK
jgi:hypothetical protein